MVSRGFKFGGGQEYIRNTDGTIVPRGIPSKINAHSPQANPRTNNVTPDYDAYAPKPFPTSNSAWTDKFVNVNQGTQAAAYSDRIVNKDPNPSRNISSAVMSQFATPGASQANPAPLTGFWNNLATQSLPPLDTTTFNPPMPSAAPSSISAMATGGENHAQTWDRIAATPKPRVSSVGQGTRIDTPASTGGASIISPFGTASSTMFNPTRPIWKISPDDKRSMY